MYNIPHSYPYLTIQDKNKLNECIDMEYVGFDEKIEAKIVSELRRYLLYTEIHTAPSASIALMLIIKSLKLENGDEIIISSINCWSVYNVITMENLKPVVCDVRSCEDFRASYTTIEEKISANTKVIVITHMFGVMVENSVILKLKRNYPHIVIIEDFSTSLFVDENNLVGLYSDFGIGSLGSTKPITGGIGGVVCGKKKILQYDYDTYSTDKIAFNIKLSRLNQVLVLNQLINSNEIIKIKTKLIEYYSQSIPIYGKSFLLFRAITFTNPNNIIKTFSKKNITLDVRTSVQPNLSLELNLITNQNALNFKPYYSLPLNFQAYRVLKEVGFIDEQ